MAASSARHQLPISCRHHPVARGRSPGRQRNFVAVGAAHPRAMRGKLAAMETDAASTAAMRRTGELLWAVAQDLLDSSDTSGSSDKGMLIVVVIMALLSCADSTRRAWRLKVSDASLRNAPAAGAIPQAIYANAIRIWDGLSELIGRITRQRTETWSAARGSKKAVWLLLCLRHEG